MSATQSLEFSPMRSRTWETHTHTLSLSPTTETVESTVLCMNSGCTAWAYVTQIKTPSASKEDILKG